MVKAVIFDMYETLITLHESPLYFGSQMALDAGIEEEKFQEIWRAPFSFLRRTVMLLPWLWRRAV